MPQIIISGNIDKYLGLPTLPAKGAQQNFPAYSVILYRDPDFYVITFTQPFNEPPAVSLQYIKGNSNDHTVEEVFIQLKSVEKKQIFVQLNEAGRVIFGNFSFIAVGDVLRPEAEI